MTQIDEAVDIREGEELDTGAVDRFMKEAIPDLQGEPEIRQYPGGASNLTYQVDYGDRSYVLRRPPFGKIAKSAHDMLREAKVMRALKPVYPYVPNIIAICDDHDVLGCDFYVMERLKGIILRQDFPKDFELSEADTRKLCLNVIDKLVDLHRVDAKAAGLDKLGKGEGYVQRQIGGWSDRFRKARTDDVGDFEQVMGWLNDKMPLPVAISSALLDDGLEFAAVLDIFRLHPALAHSIVLSLPAELVEADDHRAPLEILSGLDIGLAAEDWTGTADGLETIKKSNCAFIKLSADRLLDRGTRRSGSPAGADLIAMIADAEIEIIATDVASDEDAVSLIDIGIDLMTGEQLSPPRRIKDDGRGPLSA